MAVEDGLRRALNRRRYSDAVDVSRPRLLHVTSADLSLDLLLGPQLQAFAAAGYEVLGASAPGPYVEKLEANGIGHVSLDHATRGWSLTTDVRALSELRRVFRDLRPDIVHTHNPKPGIYGRIAAKAARVPVIVNTLHGLYATEDDRPAKRAGRVRPRAPGRGLLGRRAGPERGGPRDAGPPPRPPAQAHPAGQRHRPRPLRPRPRRRRRGTGPSPRPRPGRRRRAHRCRGSARPREGLRRALRGHGPGPLGAPAGSARRRRLGRAGQARRAHPSRDGRSRKGRGALPGHRPRRRDLLRRRGPLRAGLPPRGLPPVGHGGLGHGAPDRRHRHPGLSPGRGPQDDRPARPRPIARAAGRRHHRTDRRRRRPPGHGDGRPRQGQGRLRPATGHRHDAGHLRAAAAGEGGARCPTGTRCPGAEPGARGGSWGHRTAARSSWPA